MEPHVEAHYPIGGLAEGDLSAVGTREFGGCNVNRPLGGRNVDLPFSGGNVDRESGSPQRQPGVRRRSGNRPVSSGHVPPRPAHNLPSITSRL